MGRSIKNIIAGLSARERRLAAVMGLFFVIFFVFLFVFLFKSEIGDLEDETEQMTASLRLLEEKAAEYKEQIAATEQSAGSATQKATPLPTLVDKACKKLDMAMPDVKELPDLRHGTQWVEHGVELSIREIDLLKLTQFMEEVESNRKRFPLAITKLDINKRKRPEGYTFHVSMSISTYEREAEVPPPSKRTAASTKRRPVGAGRKGGV